MYKPQTGLQPIHIASKNGHLNLVNILIDEYKVSPDSKVTIILVVTCGNNIIINHQTDDGSQSIHCAAEGGHPDIVASLISKHGVSPQCLKVYVRS